MVFAAPALLASPFSSTGIPACAHVSTQAHRNTWHTQDFVPFACSVSSTSHGRPARFAVRFELQEKRSMTDICYTHYETPLGTTLLAADERGLRLIRFAAGKRPEHPESHWRKDPAPLLETIRQLRAYFAGELEEFHL